MSTRDPHLLQRTRGGHSLHIEGESGLALCLPNSLPTEWKRWRIYDGTEERLQAFRERRGMVNLCQRCLRRYESGAA